MSVPNIRLIIMIDYNGLFLSTLRLESTFKDDLGNSPLQGTGTCFALQWHDSFLLVTNRHMVDHSFAVKNSSYQLAELFLWCRRTNAPSIITAPERFPIGLEEAEITIHPTADVALISNIKLLNLGFTPIINPVLLDFLADDNFYSNNNLEVGDGCSFIGYPASKNSVPWWDTDKGLPVVRLASLSSLPQLNFVNSNIKSTHARLVAGLSFSGSSGSPVLNLGKNYKVINATFTPELVLPKLIGIMAGHWWYNNNEIPEMLRHTGLSYYVSSVAIWELLEKLL